MPSFAARRAASLARPPIDLRHYLQETDRDQGPRPLCVPFSVSAAHEAARAHVGAAAPEELAPEPLWSYCVQSGQTAPSGTTLEAVGNALAAEGQPLLSSWAYNSAIGAATESPPAGASAADWHAAQLIDVPLAHDGIETLVDDALSVSLPVLVVIEVTAEFENPTTTGDIAVPSLAAPAGDYHSVVAVGASTDATTSNRRLLIRNSWGARWGAGGYGWIPLDYLIGFAVQAGVVDPASCRIATQH